MRPPSFCVRLDSRGHSTIRLSPIKSRPLNSRMASSASWSSAPPLPTYPWRVEFDKAKPAHKSDVNDVEPFKVRDHILAMRGYISSIRRRPTRRKATEIDTL